MSTQERRTAAARCGGTRRVILAVLGALLVVGVGAATVVSIDAGVAGASRRGAESVEIAKKVTVEGTPLPDLPDSGTDRAVGLAAPVLKSVDFQGDDVQAGGGTGKPYALVFLAHWCPHCQLEVPRIVSLQKKLRKAGIELTGVPTGTSTQYPNYPPSEWLQREKWKYGVLVDDATRTAGQAYGLTSYPYLVFVDAQGNVAGRISGEVPVSQLKQIITALAAGKTLPISSVPSSS